MSNDRPLRVVHIALGLEMGGLEKLLVEFARHADRKHLDLHFVSLTGRGDLAGDIEEHGWPVTAFEEPPGLRPAMIPRLASLLRRLRADVVHTHNTKALVYGGPAARLARVPFVVQTYHGRNLMGSPREELAFRLAARFADRIVCVSEDSAGEMLRQGIPREKTVTICNGIDVTRFAYAGTRNDGPIVTVARLSPEKDIATLIRAVAIARGERCPLQVEIAGDGACLAALESETQELGLAGHVRFLGQVRDVPQVLERASLFVLPSLTEGISLTLLEAMARGLPVVATRVGGNAEVVVDGETGLLVPPGSPADLAQAMVRLQGDPDRGRRMGLAGRDRVERHFDIRRMVGSYEELYRRNVQPRPLPARLSTRPKLWQVLTNIVRFTDHVGPDDGIRPQFVATPARRHWRTVQLFFRSWYADAVLLDQAPTELSLLCALRTLLPFRGPALISLDLVLSRVSSGRMPRFKTWLKRGLLHQVDLFLMHMQFSAVLRQCYGITPQKVRYIPFKVNYLETLRQIDVPEGSYVFTGGRSRRDYRTFCDAMAELPYPGRIVTPRAAENTKHGTDLVGITPPANVTIVHDDGSDASWQREISGARLVVFCITPETISPSGVSGYLLAMALRKCVIISECPATRGILEKEREAILVPMQDPHRLRDAIRRVWEDDASRRMIAGAGQQYATSLGGEEKLHRNVAAATRAFFIQRQR